MSLNEITRHELYDAMDLGIITNYSDYFDLLDFWIRTEMAALNLVQVVEA